jgi:phospholipid/cholesterol/gamma-HCH transport system ATP-binding protein
MPGTSSNDSDFALSLDAVALGYGDFTVLSDISMEVRAGEVVAVMGGSGSGKTTMLRAATGQILAQRGTVKAFGQDIATASPDDLRALRQRMGVLFQQGALFTDLNVFENVAFPLREHTTFGEAAILERVLDKLDAVGLRTAAHLAVSEISGGMARRVALARAVVLEPELILYDEPFAGLDPISLGVTARLIRNLSDQLGCASVLITHDVAESFAIVDRVYLVGNGKLAASGTPATLQASQDPFVRQFLDGAPDGPVAFNYPDTPAFDSWLARQPGYAAGRRQ